MKVIRNRGFGRAVQHVLVITAAVFLSALGERQFVFARGLPRQPDAVIALVLLRECRTGEIGRVEQRILSQVEVVARQAVLESPFTVSGVEPQRVLLDGAAESSAGVVNVLHGRQHDDAAPAHLVREVAVLQVLSGVVRQKIGAEPVAAIPGHDVQIGAAGLAFGGDAAGVQDHLLHGRRVDEILRVPAA